MQTASSTRQQGKILNIVIPAQAAGLRLELYLRRELQFTRAQIKSIKFRKNGLLLNGERVRVTEVLHGGENLEILLEEQAQSSAQLEVLEQPIEILYEDADLVAVWKEAGMPLHPAHGHYSDTLTNAVHGYFSKKGQSVTIRSIGRLDKDTSGIVIFVKNQVAAARLWRQKEQGIFQKEYLAVCEGKIEGISEEWQEISAPIANVPDEKNKMCVSPDGKHAVTHYCVIGEVIKNDIICSIIRVRIETGRTHQIRVHMASIGHPLAGDPIYGTGHTGTAGANLCAWKTWLEQPFSGERIEVEKSGSIFSETDEFSCIFYTEQLQ